jgi:predicted dehydrogenase
MEAFQNLIATKRINIDYLTTHEFEFENAKEAFDLVVSKTEPFTGIALKYNLDKAVSKSRISTSESNQLGKINISFIGAGSYAQGNLLPNIPETKDVGRVGVLTNTGTTSKRVAEKFKFQFCATNEDDVLDDKTNTVFVATRHDSHGPYVLKSLEANKNVFVEKPLCLLESELESIIDLQSKTGKAVMVGFNRRFSPLTAKLKKAVGNNPMTMIYRINAGSIPGDNWIQDLEIGGGRVLGEVCHFIDYLTYLNGSLPTKISATALPDANQLNDTLNILVQFENGSSGVIGYYANGSKSLTKEYVEVFSAGMSATLNDFKELKIYGKGKPKKDKLLNQNKGQKEMVNAFVNGLLINGKAPISFEEIVAVTKASFGVLESVKRGGQQVEI